MGNRVGLIIAGGMLFIALLFSPVRLLVIVDTEYSIDVCYRQLMLPNETPVLISFRANYWSEFIAFWSLTDFILFEVVLVVSAILLYDVSRRWILSRKSTSVNGHEQTTTESILANSSLQSPQR